MNAPELTALIKAGEAKLDRVRAEAAALPHGMQRKHLEHLIKGAESGLQTLRIQLAGMEGTTSCV